MKNLSILEPQIEKHYAYKRKNSLKKVFVSPTFIINVHNPLEEPFSIKWAK